MTDAFEWRLSHGSLVGSLTDFDRHLTECAGCQSRYRAAYNAGRANTPGSTAPDLTDEPCPECFTFVPTLHRRWCSHAV